MTHINKFIKITLDDLMKEIKSIDVTKSSGFRDISTKVLKVIFFNTPMCLLHIMNRCIETNTFPELWKVSLTTPIPKKGDCRQLKNICPISILALPGKILEKFINQELIEYLESNNLLCNEQGGFRKNHSGNHVMIFYSLYIMQIINLSLHESPKKDGVSWRPITDCSRPADQSINTHVFHV